MASLSERLFDAVEGYLAAIDGTGLYNTDAGLRILRNASTGVADTLPCLRLFDGGEVAENASGDRSAIAITQTVIVDAIVAAGADAGAELLAVKADIKRALMQWERQKVTDGTGDIATCLTYLGAQPFPRADGATAEAITLTFTTKYREAYGNPDSH